MKSGDYTSMGGTAESFRTTHWTVIEEIGPSQGSRHKALVEELLKLYWKPVYYYLRHKGFNNEDAKDLTQGFFQEVVLGHDLLRRADRTKGRFRTLLLRALDRYLVSVHRKETARKRIPHDKVISLNEATLDKLPEALGCLTSEDVFHYTWVCDLLDRLLGEVETECRQRGMQMHWDLFYDRVLYPILSCTKPPPLAELCREYGVAATANASNMIFAVKRRFQAAAKRLLRQAVASEPEIDEEMLELAKFLAKGRQYCQ